MMTNGERLNAFLLGMAWGVAFVIGVIGFLAMIGVIQ
jgi:hypothetical protein